MRRSGMSRFVFPFVLCSILVTSSPVVHAIPKVVGGKVADAGQIAQDIASAGRLRMQSQRLAKLYLQAGIGLKAGLARQQIDATIGEVDAEFVRLARYGQKSAVQRVYARSEALWQEMRVAATKAPDIAAVERFNQIADDMMVHTGKLAMLIEGEGETPIGRLLDLSSRLNMLSQRLARLYLQAYGGNQTQGILVDIEQARKEFASGLLELDMARENSPASRDAIGLARNQWVFFDSSISELSKIGRREERAAQNVISSSERIAQVLDQTSLQYVKDFTEGSRSNR